MNGSASVCAYGAEIVERVPIALPDARKQRLAASKPAAQPTTVTSPPRDNTRAARLSTCFKTTCMEPKGNKERHWGYFLLMSALRCRRIHKRGLHAADAPTGANRINQPGTAAHICVRISHDLHFDTAIAWQRISQAG